MSKSLCSTQHGLCVKTSESGCKRKWWEWQVASLIQFLESTAVAKSSQSADLQQTQLPLKAIDSFSWQNSFKRNDSKRGKMIWFKFSFLCLQIWAQNGKTFVSQLLFRETKLAIEYTEHSSLKRSSPPLSLWMLEQEAWEDYDYCFAVSVFL